MKNVALDASLTLLGDSNFSTAYSGTVGIGGGSTGGGSPVQSSIGAGGFNGYTQDFGGPFTSVSAGGKDFFGGTSADGSRPVFGGGFNIGGKSTFGGATGTSAPKPVGDAAILLPALMLPAMISSLIASVLCH